MLVSPGAARRALGAPGIRLGSSMAVVQGLVSTGDCVYLDTIPPFSFDLT